MENNPSLYTLAQPSAVHGNKAAAAKCLLAGLIKSIYIRDAANASVKWHASDASMLAERYQTAFINRDALYTFGSLSAYFTAYCSLFSPLSY